MSVGSLVEPGLSDEGREEDERERGARVPLEQAALELGRVGDVDVVVVVVGLVQQRVVGRQALAARRRRLRRQRHRRAARHAALLRTGYGDDTFMVISC